MKERLNLALLNEIYLVSNTPLYFYKRLLQDGQVIEASEGLTTQQLIVEFNLVSRTKINSIEDLVFAYALYLAILIREDEDTFTFLESPDGLISFEWFTDFRSIFLSRRKSISVSEITQTSDTTDHAASEPCIENQTSNYETTTV